MVGGQGSGESREGYMRVGLWKRVLL